MAGRRRARSGSQYEGRYGYCRAVAAGDRIVVSGTAPVWPDGSCDPNPAVQAQRCCEIIVEALAELGADARDVIRTRMYVTDPGIADAVGAAHREFFGEAEPAATMVAVSALLDPRWRVEIEAEAYRRTNH
jgi:enamine deaminase RidA (YjgF/YER057c/UK114 family)